MLSYVCRKMCRGLFCAIEAIGDEMSGLFPSGRTFSLPGSAANLTSTPTKRRQKLSSQPPSKRRFKPSVPDKSERSKSTRRKGKKSRSKKKSRRGERYSPVDGDVSQIDHYERNEEDEGYDVNDGLVGLDGSDVAENEIVGERNGVNDDCQCRECRGNAESETQSLPKETTATQTGEFDEQHAIRMRQQRQRQNLRNKNKLRSLQEQKNLSLAENASAQQAPCTHHERPPAEGASASGLSPKPMTSVASPTESLPTTAPVSVSKDSLSTSAPPVPRSPSPQSDPPSCQPKIIPGEPIEPVPPAPSKTRVQSPQASVTVAGSSLPPAPCASSSLPAPSSQVRSSSRSKLSLQQRRESRQKLKLTMPNSQRPQASVVPTKNGNTLKDLGTIDIRTSDDVGTNDVSTSDTNVQNDGPLRSARRAARAIRQAADVGNSSANIAPSHDHPRQTSAPSVSEANARNVELAGENDTFQRARNALRNIFATFENTKRACGEGSQVFPPSPIHNPTELSQNHSSCAQVSADKSPAYTPTSPISPQPNTFIPPADLNAQPLLTCNGQCAGIPSCPVVDADVGVCLYDRTPQNNNISSNAANAAVSGEPDSREIISLQPPTPPQMHDANNNTHNDNNFSSNEGNTSLHTPPSSSSKLSHTTQSSKEIVCTSPALTQKDTCAPDQSSVSSTCVSSGSSTKNRGTLSETNGMPSSSSDTNSSVAQGESLDFSCKICARRQEMRWPISFARFEDFEQHYRLHHQVQ